MAELQPTTVRLTGAEIIRGRSFAEVAVHRRYLALSVVRCPAVHVWGAAPWAPDAARDAAVAVGGSSRDGAAVRGVFENDNARGLVVVDGQVIATIEGECGAIRAIQLGCGLGPSTPARCRGAHENSETISLS
jgi:hypothetical protein